MSIIPPLPSLLIPLFSSLSPTEYPRIVQMSVGRKVAALAALAIVAGVALILSGGGIHHGSDIELLAAKKALGLKGVDVKLLKVSGVKTERLRRSARLDERCPTRGQPVG